MKTATLNLLRVIAVFSIVVTILGLPPNSYAQELVRLSLNPFGAHLDNGASLIASGFDAPIRLPANQNLPGFALGFTIPNDYKPNTPLRIVILWESPATKCIFALRPSFLFRAREGQPSNFSDAAGGLTPLRASTPFSLAGDTITMAAPDTAHQTASVRFRITRTPVEFPTLRQGDAINFGVFRGDRQSGDTCNDGLGVAGVSIIYDKKDQRENEPTVEE